MQALSDEQQLERLEKKVDDVVAQIRTESKETRDELRSEIQHWGSELHADIRVLTVAVLGMFMTMIFGFAGIILNHL